MAEKQKNNETEGPDLDRVGRVASKAEIESLRIVSLHVHTNLPARRDERFPEALEAAQANTNLVFGATAIPLEDDHLQIDTEFHLVSGQDAEDLAASLDEAAVAVHCELQLFYRVEGLSSFSDEDLAAFADVNGVFNAWPYWREVVDSAFARMELPRLVMPVYRVPARAV